MATIEYTLEIIKHSDIQMWQNIPVEIDLRHILVLHTYSCIY